VRLPNADRAVIPHQKLYGYLLSRAHPVGRFKAAFFAKLGYMSDTWQRFSDDLRTQHLTQQVSRSTVTPFGTNYEIRAILKGPQGPPTVVISVWFVPKDGDVPTFVTAYPGDPS
jgi:hypothetical protein